MGGVRLGMRAMDPHERPPRRETALPLDAFQAIVPPRAVLTELARGFLLTHDGDPERAKKFAMSFLREQTGPPGPGRIIPINRRPTVRRGIDAALEGRSGPNAP
jgi:hypothetical protein